MKTTITSLLLIAGLVMVDPLCLRANNGSLTGKDTIVVMPNWPITREGHNERGGIYCNLDSDSDLEIVFTIGSYVYAFNVSGTEVPGWPVELNYPTDGAAAFGDIDGDGKGEIVVTTHQPSSYNDGMIYAFETNGTSVSGFPVTTDGGPLRSPVLADLDDDGNMEIIVAVRDWPEGFIHAYEGNGILREGWPQRMDYIPASEVAVGDITGDDIPEIIAESYYSLHAYTAGGQLLPGFPFTPGNDRVFSYSSPVLADIDENGFREILFGDHSTSASDGRLYILRNDGTSLDNWPQSTSSGIYGPPAVGDIDGDNDLDVVVGEYGFNFGIYKLYGWDGNTGQFLPGFPVLGLNSVNNQVILADLDGDEEIEMMFDDNTSAGVYPGYNHDGTPMDGWPLSVNGTSFYINPFVADLNGDGIMEICGGGYDPEADETSIYLWETAVDMNDDLAILPVFQYNTRHNGVTGDHLMVGEPEIETNTPQPGHLVISPNPARDHVLIRLAENLSGPVNLEIIDFSSRIALHMNLTIRQNQDLTVPISIQEIPAGIYFVRIISPAEVYSGKLIISD